MKKEIPLLALIVLVSGTLSVALLTHGHLWWDDFASYIMQAQSILRGDMAGFVRHNAITILQSSYPQGPLAYPWGFPLILVPFYAFFGLNILALKLVNILFYGLFLTFFFFHARNRLPLAASGILVGFFAFNPALLSAHDLLLSDLPFLAITTLAILLIEKDSPRPAGQLALGANLFLAVFIRTTGIALLLALPLHDLARAQFHLRDMPRQLLARKITYAAFAGLFLLEKSIFPGGQASYFSHFSQFSLRGLLENTLYYLALPVELFEGLPFPALLAALAAILFLLGLRQHWKSELPGLTFSLILFTISILWPERQGLRFIYPILPTFILLAWRGGESLLGGRPHPWRHLHTGLWITLTALAFFISLGRGGLLTGLRPEINGPFDPVSAEMFAYVRQNTPPEAKIIFFRPRALRLFTGRDAIMLTECARLGEGDYIIIHKKQENIGQVAPEQVETCNPTLRLESIFDNRRFIIYRPEK